MKKTKNNTETANNVKFELFKNHLRALEQETIYDFESGKTAYNVNNTKQAIGKTYLNKIFTALTTHLAYDDSDDAKRRFLFIVYGEVMRIGALDLGVAKNFAGLLKDYTNFIFAKDGNAYANSDSERAVKIVFQDGPKPDIDDSDKTNLVAGGLDA